MAPIDGTESDYIERVFSLCQKSKASVVSGRLNRSFWNRLRGSLDASSST